MGIIEQIAQINAELEEKGLAKGLRKGLKKGLEQGLEKGRAEKDRLFVKNLLKGTDFTQKKIASLANVSPAFVRKIKASLRPN